MNELNDAFQFNTFEIFFVELCVFLIESIFDVEVVIANIQAKYI